MKKNILLFLIASSFLNCLNSITVKIKNGLDFPIRVSGYEFIVSPGAEISFDIASKSQTVIEDFVYIKNDNLYRKSLCIFYKNLFEKFIIKNNVLNFKLFLNNENELDLVFLNPVINIKNRTNYTVFVDNKYFEPQESIHIVLSENAILFSEIFNFVENRDFSFHKKFCILDSINLKPNYNFDFKFIENDVALVIKNKKNNLS